MWYGYPSVMPSVYKIEMSKPSTSRCDCCGGLSVRLTRFVYRNGDAFAIYYAAYSNNHPDNELAMLVSLGEWGEDAAPSRRAAFYCQVRPTDDSYEVMLGDASESAWSGVDIIGEKLSREQARQHPWKETAFEVLDEAFVHDPSLRGFLQRVQCGDASVPLEKSFHAPDDIFALGDEQKNRVEVRQNFASLDGERFFVRCLLPAPVEDYGTWCVGLWIEVAKTDYDRVRKAWNDPDLDSTLRFPGVIANDVGTDLGLPIAMGSKVQLHVPDRETPPRIEAPAAGDLSELLTKVWAKAAFEEYAVGRGFL